MIYENLKQKQRKNLQKRGRGGKYERKRKWCSLCHFLFTNTVFVQNISKFIQVSKYSPNIALYFPILCPTPSLHSKINGFFCFSLKSIYWLYMYVHVYLVCLPSTVSTISTNSLIAVHWRRLRHVFKSCLMILCLF